MIPAAAAACAFLTAWVYWPIMSHGFVNLEDYWLILANVHLRAPVSGQLGWMFTSLEYGTYQPLGWLSYALLRGPREFDPAVIHLASWLAHAACAALLYFVAARVFKAAAPEATEGDLALAAAAAAASWALHPQRVEQVAWATGLPDVLATACYLAAVLAYLADGSGRRRPAALAFGLFLLSSLFRWKGVGLPVVLVALDVCVLKRPLKWSVWLEKIPFILLAVLFAALNSRSKLQLAPGHAFSLGLHTFSGPLFYLWKMLLPFNLTVDYWVPESVFLAASFVSVSAAALVPKQWRFTAGAAWVCFVASILPSLLMSFNGLVVAHDRSTYLPAMSLHLLLGGVLLGVIRSGPGLKKLALAGAAAGLMLCAVFSRGQIPVWRDSITLWEHVLEEPYPPNYAHLSLAQAWLERGDRKAAAAQLREQLRLYPGDVRVKELSQALDH